MTSKVFATLYMYHVLNMKTTFMGSTFCECMFLPIII
jgi:hypothetical protein